MKPTKEISASHESPLGGRKTYLLGTLGGLTKRESSQVVRQAGGKLQETLSSQIETIILGLDHPGLETLPEFDDALRDSVAQGSTLIVRETELWELLSQRDEDGPAQQLYSPAMLAELLHVPVRTVRRWCRAGLIQPVKEVLHLPLFDYAELTTARQLAKWGEEGATVQSIQRQLAALSELAPTTGRPIQQLAITAEGKQLLMRHGSTLVESTGQFRFSFDDQGESSSDETQTLAFESIASRRINGGAITKGQPTTFDQMIEQALASEDENDLDGAIEWYRTALAAYGPNADVCFQLAELLYRLGDSSAARERYYMALEIDSGLVEARANLGCVLVECGQIELAVAAFEGTLQQFEDYADVHFHLARALDELGETSKANKHWQRFVELAPASPWAEEAHQRLSTLQPTLEF